MKIENSVPGGIQYGLVFILLLLFYSCAKDPESGNQKPNIAINPQTDGLKITLKGAITDPDGSISNVIVYWGDQKSEYLIYTDFASLEVSHIYPDPANYIINVVAFDNKGDSTEHSFAVNIDFKETSLEGIKQSMFKTSANEYLILSLNLHTYQETQQNEKFNLITDVIGKMDIDFIAFQECAQHKSAAFTTGIIREDNMALILSDRLKAKYNVGYTFVWNWAHYGWTVWEEGVAILSKHPLINSEDRYISTYTGTSDITSRKVIFGSYQTSNGVFNLFSAHTHWRLTETDEEQNNQIRKIKLMAAEKWALTSDSLAFICGDFNGNPTSDSPWSEGYFTMMQNNEYTDTYLHANPEANNKPAQSIYNTIGGDFPGRIDYIFMKNNPHLTVIDSQIIFTSDCVGRVSDHFGVLTKVRFND